MSANNSVLSVENLGIKFTRGKSLFHGRKKRSFWAIRNTTFSLDKGDVLGVIGPNGSGKSTLLKALSGIYLPNEGRVLNHGVSVALLSVSAGFINNLSGRENAVLSGLLLGIPKETVLANLEAMKKLSELGEFFEEPIKTYSSGMKSRLGFSVAYYLNPDVTFIDEVISVGDQGFREKSSTLMKEKIKAGKTAIVVSHNMDLISDLCTRLIVLGHGKKPKEHQNIPEAIEEYKKTFKK